jgi:hypothetical protein
MLAILDLTRKFQGGLRRGFIPCALVVKETISSLLKLIRNRLRLLVSLEPGLVLLVEAPTLVLERLRRKVLLICALSVVEDVEEGVGVNSASLI